MCNYSGKGHQRALKPWVKDCWGVSWWLSGLRVQHCCCCAWVTAMMWVWSLAPGTSTCSACSQKKKKKTVGVEDIHTVSNGHPTDRWLKRKTCLCKKTNYSKNKMNLAVTISTKKSIFVSLVVERYKSVGASWWEATCSAHHYLSIVNT